MLLVFGSPHFALPGLAAVFSPALNVSTTTNKLRAIAGAGLVPASSLQVAQLVQQSVVQPGSSRVALVPVPLWPTSWRPCPPATTAAACWPSWTTWRPHTHGCTSWAPAPLPQQPWTCQLWLLCSCTPTWPASLPCSTLQHGGRLSTASRWAARPLGTCSCGHCTGGSLTAVLGVNLHAGDHDCMITAACWLRALGAGNHPSCAAVCRPASTCQTCPSSMPSSSSIWSPRGMAVQQRGSAHPPAGSRPPTSVASWAL